MKKAFKKRLQGLERAAWQSSLLITACCGCGHVKPFSFRIEDASTRQGVNYVTVYWTESWLKIGARMPERTRSGLISSGSTNFIEVVDLNESVDNKFRFTAETYQPLTLEYIPHRGSPAVGLFDTLKSPRPIQVFDATNRVITIGLRREKVAASP